jgi:hypothetical protein
MPQTITREDLLRIRFIGSALQRNGVPIYQLGKSLIALQRMVHKARMLEKRNEARRPFLSFEERSQFALQILERRQGSDEYGLGSFLSNPIVVGAIGGYIGWIMSALSKYAMRQVLHRGRDKDDRQHVFNIYIFNQLYDLAGRIGGVGGVDAIEIGSSIPDHEKTVRLDADFKHYVNSIKNQLAYGTEREITGKVVELLPGEDAVKISREPEGLIKVMLSPEHFQNVRYCEVKDPVIRVIGEPIYRLGVETYYYEAFKARELVIVNEPPDKSHLSRTLTE